MDELKDFDWSYNVPDTRDFIGEESSFRSSAMYKVIVETFRDPLRVDPPSGKKPLTAAEKKTKKKDSNLSKQKLTVAEAEPELGVKDDNFSINPSKLSIAEHKLGVKMLKYYNRNIISFPQVDASPFEIKKYDSLQDKISVERRLFLEFAKKKWSDDSTGKMNLFNVGIDNFIGLVWKEKKKILKNYPRYYKTAGTLPLVYLNESNPIEMKLLQSLENVNPGSLIEVPLHKVPNFGMKFNQLRKNYKEYRECVGKKLPISADPKCVKFAVEHRADVVISLSGLKWLGGACPPFDSSWNIPIDIRSYSVNDRDNKNKEHKIVYIDQVLPNLSYDSRQKRQSYYKTILKLRKLNYNQKLASIDLKKIKPNESENSDDSEDDRLVIDDPDDNEEEEKKVSSSIYSYRLWKIGQSIDERLSKTAKKPLTVLVRCKSEYKEALDGRERELVLTTKVENQSEYGSETPSLSEAVSNWANLYFRPHSQLARMRVCPESEETILVEKLSLNTLYSEAQKSTSWKLQTALGCYFNVFNSLIEFPIGTYLLRHEPKHYAFAHIFKSQENPSEDGLDLHGAFNVKFEDLFSKCPVPWLPLDPTVIDLKFHARQVMPCMFPPQKNATNGPRKFLTNKPQKKKKGKKKSKRKISKL